MFCVRNLGYQTDFIFNKLDGSLVFKEDYLVVSCESNPNFFWGNLLYFKSSPTKDDFQSWINLFDREFNNPKIYHKTFAWDSLNGECGDIDEFLANGFELEKSIVLSTHKVHLPRKFNKELIVKEIKLDEKMVDVIDIQVAGANSKLSKSSWRSFYEVTMNNYNNLIKKGHGHWYGAFLDGRLVGSLGLFFEDNIGRFQIVSTDPSYQRLGVCSTLVYEVSLAALQSRASQLVMVADESYHAAKIYESVGFIPSQKMVGLCWYDSNKV